MHARSLGVATQALLLLFQLMSSRSTVSDRFYRWGLRARVGAVRKQVVCVCCVVCKQVVCVRGWG